MNINRNNYEEFFMLYADNELPAVQRKQVEEFVAGNPDLKQELELFQQFKLSPDAAVIFNNKASLLKQEEKQAGIAIDNYESYFVLYADDELSNSEKAAVEDFVYRQPALQDEFELLQQARLMPDAAVIFKHKESLYRREKDEKIIPFRWWRIAIAAAVLLFVSGLLWINKNRKDDGRTIAIIDKSNPVKPAVRAVIKDSITKKMIDKEQSTAATGIQPKNGMKNTKQARPTITVVKSKINNKSSNIPEQADVTPKEEYATVSGNDLKSTTIDPIPQEKIGKADIRRPLIAAPKEPMIDQPAIILNPDENKTPVEYASLNTDNVEVLNTTVNTKNALRGFLRKASRLIAKKTDAGNEDGKRKGILIGGFEIAVR
jgi:hypothetical protein